MTRHSKPRAPLFSALVFNRPAPRLDGRDNGEMPPRFLTFWGAERCQKDTLTPLRNAAVRRGSAGRKGVFPPQLGAGRGKGGEMHVDKKAAFFAYNVDRIMRNLPDVKKRLPAPPQASPLFGFPLSLFICFYYILFFMGKKGKRGKEYIYVKTGLNT